MLLLLLFAVLILELREARCFELRIDVNESCFCKLIDSGEIVVVVLLILSRLNEGDCIKLFADAIFLIEL